MKLRDQAITLARRGVLNPGPPHRVARQLLALRTWGFGLAGEARQAAARSPRAIAVVDETRGRFTYAELVDNSDRAARVLLDRVRPGERIGVLARNHVGLLEVLIGASTAGIDVVLVNTGLSGPQLAAVAEEQELGLLVHDLEFADRLGSVTVPLLSEDELLAAIQTAGGSETVGGPRDASARDGAAAPLTPPERPGRTIVLTSGTTGSPKGARRPTPKGFSALASILSRIPLRPRQTVVLAAPIFHTWGYAFLQLSIGLRSTIVLSRRFDPAETRASLRRHRAEVLAAVPVMIQRMLELPADRTDGRLGGEQLRIVAVSGSALPSGFATRFMASYGPVLHNLYGSTECSWVAIADPEDLAADPDSSGRPPKGTRVSIVGDDDEEVGPGEIGRVFVGNDLLFEGYTNGQTKDVWHGLTSIGDLGRWHDGRLRIEGREDDMIVSGGENVYPAELEGVIAAMPEVREVSVFGVPDEQFGKRLVACVVLVPDAALTDDEVVERARAGVARHSLPREVVFLDELPRNATGKVLVRELQTRWVPTS